MKVKRHFISYLLLFSVFEARVRASTDVSTVRAYRPGSACLPGAPLRLLPHPPHIQTGDRGALHHPTFICTFTLHPTYTPASDAVPFLPQARYIYIDMSTTGNTLNLQEITAYTIEGYEISAASCTMDSQHTSFSASNCIDGDLDTMCHNNNGGYNGWLEVDLGAQYNIGVVEVYNRQYCCSDRIDGALLQLWSDSSQTGTLLWEQQFDMDEEDYPFTFTIIYPSPLPTSMPTSSSLPTMSSVPTLLPTLSLLPTPLPTGLPTAIPTLQPSWLPTPQPSLLPTMSSLPTLLPTMSPQPTPLPTCLPTTPQPTLLPTTSPRPTTTPTGRPTKGPWDVLPLPVGEAVAGDTSSNSNTIGNSAPDQFFVFAPNATAEYVFSTCGSKFDTYLRFYSTDGSSSYSEDSTALISSHDDDGASYCTEDACSTSCCMTVVTKQMEAGETYVVLLEGYSGESGEYRLSVYQTDVCNGGDTSTCQGVVDWTCASTSAPSSTMLPTPVPTQATRPPSSTQPTTTTSPTMSMTLMPTALPTTPEPTPLGGCYEAYTPSFSCSGYTGCGYTCVGSFCAYDGARGCLCDCTICATYYMDKSFDATTARCTYPGMVSTCFI